MPGVGLQWRAGATSQWLREWNAGVAAPVAPFLTLVGSPDTQIGWFLPADVPTFTMNVPAGNVNDILIAYGTSATAMAPPAGWLGIGADVGGGFYLGAYRVCDGSEGSTVTLTYDTFIGTLYDGYCPFLVRLRMHPFTAPGWGTAWTLATTGGGGGPPIIQSWTAQATTFPCSVVIGYIFADRYTPGTFDADTDETITWDAQLAPNVLATGHIAGTHRNSVADPTLFGTSAKWSLTWVSTFSGTNPATSSSIAGPLNNPTPAGNLEWERST